MLRFWKRIWLAAAVLAIVPLVAGFSLLGPGGAEGIVEKEWQLPAQNFQWEIGYNQPGLDIGSPVNPFLEFYRWNVPVITYAFDDNFIQFFGKEGIKAVEGAVRILAELPP